MFSGWRLCPGGGGMCCVVECGGVECGWDKGVGIVASREGSERVISCARIIALFFEKQNDDGCYR